MHYINSNGCRDKIELLLFNTHCPIIFFVTEHDTALLCQKRVHIINIVFFFFFTLDTVVGLKYIFYILYISYDARV